MHFSEELLQTAMHAGSKRASAAFSKLAGSEVQVNVSEVVFKSLNEIVKKFKIYDSINPVFAYSQIIKGVNGVSFLVMTREEAFDFIDLMNKKPLGTTGVLMDVDRSAIKETLNILSNSYLNSLAEQTGTDLLVGDPRLITLTGLNDIFNQFSGLEERVIVFRTELEISQRQIHAELYLIFHEKLAELMKSTH